MKSWLFHVVPPFDSVHHVLNERNGKQKSGDHPPVFTFERINSHVEKKAGDIRGILGGNRH